MGGTGEADLRNTRCFKSHFTKPTKEGAWEPWARTSIWPTPFFLKLPGNCSLKNGQ